MRPVLGFVFELGGGVDAGHRGLDPQPRCGLNLLDLLAGLLGALLDLLFRAATVLAGGPLVRLRVLVDAYGLDDAGRRRLATAVIGHHEWMCALVDDGARRGVPGFAAYWTPGARERADRTRSRLERQAGAIVAALQ